MHAALKSFLIMPWIVGMALFLPSNALADNIWPSVRLPTPSRDMDRQYLGLSKGDTFALSKIDANLIVVQIYSMYCPICQREASQVNTLYNMIAARKEIAAETKLLAIGAGNSDYEVNFYRSTYKVVFPLFSDVDYKLHKLLGEVGTPYYYLLKKDKMGHLRQVYAKAGAFASPEVFLKIIIDKLK